MGVSIEIWRARIGGYCQPNRETRTEVTHEPMLHIRGIALLRNLKILVIISLLLILSGNVELNPGPTLRRPQQGPSQTCYTYKDSSFTTQEVLDILHNPDMSRTITQPPLKPTAGQVFVYHFTDINKRDDWRCDQYHFHHDATREQPKADPKFKKLFFVIKTREGKDKRFKKHAYILLGEDNNLVLFQYIGDERIAEDLPHGNSKNASVPYTRLCPSVLRAIKDVSSNATHAMEQFKNRAIALATPEIHQPRSKVHIWNTKSSVKYKQRQKQKKKHTVKSGENTTTNHLSGECKDVIVLEQTSCENIEMCSLEHPLRSELDRSCVNVCIKDEQACEETVVHTNPFEGVIEQSAVDTDLFTGVPGQSAIDANSFEGVIEQSAVDTDLFTGVPGQSAADTDSFEGVIEQSAVDTDSFTGVPGQSAADTDSFEGVIEQSAVDTNSFTGVPGQPTMDTNLFGNVPGQSAADTDSFKGVIEQSAVDTDSFTGVPGQSEVDTDSFEGVIEQSAVDTDSFTGVPGQSEVDANSFTGVPGQPTMDTNTFQGLTGPSAGTNSAHSSNPGISPYLLPQETDSEDVSTPASVSDHLSQRQTETHVCLSHHCDTAGVTGNHSEYTSMTSTQRDDGLSCEITCDDKTGTSVPCIYTAGNMGVKARDPRISPTIFMCCRDMNTMCLEGPPHESSPCIPATVIQMKETFGQPNLKQQGNGQLSTLAVSIDEFVFQIYDSGELVNVIEVLSEFLKPQSYRKMRFMECLSLKSKELYNDSELSMFSDGSLNADRRCDPLFDVILTEPATSLITQSATLWKAEFDNTRDILSQYTTDIPPREQVTGCFLQLLSAVVLGSYKTHSRITQFVDTLYERPRHCQDITEHVCYVDSEYTYIIGTYSVTGRELTRLENSAWLDDSVIHAYMSLIMTEYEGQRNGKVFMFDCFLAEKWSGKLNDIDDGWLYLKESLLDYDWILMPVCRNHHWVLIAAHVKARQLSVIDSLPSRGSQSQHLLKQWRNYMAIRSKRTGENIPDWEDRSCPIFPQTDGNSCGVIVLMVAEALLSGVPPAIMRNCHVKDYRENVKQRLLAAAGVKRCDKIEVVPDQPGYDAYQETDMDVTDDVELYSPTNDKDDEGTGFLRTNGHVEGEEEEDIMKGSLSMPRPVDNSMEEESQEAALDLRNVSTKIRHLFNNKHRQFAALLVACLRDGDLSFSFLNDTSDDQPCPLLQSPIRWACHIAGIEMVSLGELKHNLNLLCAFFTITSNDETATFEKQTIKHIVNEFATNHVDNYLQSIDIMFVHKHVRILPKCDAERSQFIIWLTRGSQELLVRRLSHELKQSNFALVLTHEACEQFQFVVSLLKLFQHNHVQMTQIVLEEDAIYGGSFLHWVCCSNNAELYKLINSHIPSESKYDCITSCCISGNADVLSIVLVEVKKEKALNWISKNEQPWLNIYRKKQMSIEKVTTFKMPPLHLACYHGHVNIVSLLIASDYDLNSHLPSPFPLFPNGPTPVIVATAEGHAPVLKCLIAENCDLSLGDETMDTSLHVACRKGFTDIVNLLVCQCNVSERNKNGDTPIHLACAAGYDDIVNTLLDHDADISLLNFRDYTAIDILSEQGHHLLLQDVLKKRPYPLPFDILNTPLHKACESDHIDVVEILLEHKADNFANCDHPLLRASKDNKVDFVNFLMETNSAAALITTDHSYLLDVACRTVNVDIMKLLLDKGADPLACEDEGDTCLGIAIEKEHVELVKLLLDKGADVQTTHSSSHLSVACRGKNVEIVKLLLDNRADPSACDDKGYSCLQIAIQKDNVEMVKLLLDKGADVQTTYDGYSPLGEACRTKNVEIVKLLLDKGADPSACDDKGYSCLEIAIQNEHVEIVKLLLDKGEDVQTTDDVYSPQIEACRTRNVEIVKLLLDKGADPSVCDDEGETCLWIAIENEHVEMVKLLLDKGADVQTTHDGYSPLIEACRTKNVEIVKLLLDKGADPSACDDKGYSCLQIAIQNEHVEMVKLLLDKGADVQTTDDVYSPLIEACRTRNVEIVKLLLDKGADPSACDDEGETCLEIATENEHVEIVKLLLDKGADVQTTHDGYSPLSEACRTRNVEIVKLLLDNRADPSACDDKGYSCLQIAIQKDNVEMVKLLLDKGADVQTTHDGYSPLSEACRTKNVEIVKLLLDKGADLSACDDKGYSCLQIAIQKDNVEIVKLLLDKGADVQTTHDGYSPLSEACRTKNVEIVKLLLDKGADPSACDDKGYSCLYIAIQNEHVEMVKLLLDKGADVQTTHDGYSPLSETCRTKNVEIVKLLLDNRADLSACDDKGYSCLQIAIQKDNVEMVKLLLDKGADMEPSFAGHTPLSETCRTKNVEIVKLLLDNRADPSACDDKGYSCLQIAIQNEHVEMVKLLLDKGADMEPSFAGHTLLSEACRTKNVEIVKLLLDNRADPSACDDKGYSCLQIAIQKDNVEMVKLLLDKGADMEPSFAGHTPLSEACRTKNVEIVKVLLDNRADPSACDDKGYSCLQIAIQNEHVEMVKLLLDKGADMEPSFAGHTLLSEACRTKNVEIVKLLLDNRADPSACDDKGYSCLQIAIQNEHVEMVKLLLDKGADMEPSFAGHTLLSEACRTKNVEIVKLLLDNRADPSACDDKGYSCLEIAIQNEHVEMVKLLLDKGTDVQTTDDVYSPLIEACRTRNVEIVKLLLDKGADPSACDDKGYSCLQIAIQKDNVEMVKLLLDKGADVQTTHDGYSPLGEACRTKNVEIVKLLLDNRADPSACDDKGYSCLQIAIQKDNVQMVKLLLDKGADVQTTHDGYSPLIEACRTKNVEIVKLLLDNRADPSACDDKGYSCLQIAIQKDNVEMVKLLLDKGADMEPSFAGHTPLSEACRTKNVEIVKLLLDKGACPPAAEFMCNSASCRVGYMDVVKRLLEKGVTVSAIASEDYSTPEVVFRKGHFENVKLLRDNMDKMFFSDFLLRHHTTNLGILNSGEHEATGDNAVLSLANNEEYNEHKQLGESKVADIVGQNDSVIYKCHGRSQCIAFCRKLFDKAIDVCKLLSCHKDLEPVVEEIIELISDSGMFTDNENSISGISQILLYESVFRRKAYLVYILIAKCGIKVTSTIMRQMLNVAVTRPDNAILQMLLKYSSGDLVDVDLMSCACSRGLLQVIIGFIEKGYKFSSDHLRLALKHKHPIMTNLIVSNMSDPMPTGLVKELIKHGVKLGHEMIPILDSEIFTSFNSDQIMFEACFHEQFDILKLLIDNDADVHCVNSGQKTLLHTACINDNETIVDFLIQSGICLNSCDSQGETPLHKAVEKNNSKVVQLLIKRGADVNCCSRVVSPLQLACKKGFISVIIILLKAGAEVNSFDTMQVTPILHACKNRNFTIASLLLKHDADVHVEDVHGTTPLHVACQHRDIVLIKLLLCHSADPFKRDNNKTCPLGFVVKDKDIMSIICEYTKGYVQSCKDENGNTLLHHACMLGLLWHATNLLTRGIDSSQQNMKGESPMHIAVENENINLVRELLRNNCTHTVPDNDGKMPLHIASEEGYADIVELLLDHTDKEGISATDNEGNSALHCASKFDKSGIIALLLEAGIKVNSINQKGSTPLHFAAEGGYLDAVKLLVHAKADINAFGNKGHTPLHRACFRGHISVVNFLLDNNADAVIQNSHKNTPMYAACLGQHMDVVKLLLEKGDYQQVAGPNGYPCVVVAASRGDLELLEIMISHNAHLSPSNLNVSLLSNESDIQHIYSLLADEEEGISHMKVDDYQQIAQDVDKSNMDSLVPIHLAYDGNHMHAFKQLVDNGAILSDLDGEGKTVFQKAFRNKDEDNVALILSKGFQPDMSSSDIIQLYPVLERCYSKRYFNVIKILYESWKIYSVNNTEQYTDSPVILAIIMDNISLLRHFLDMDGDFTERDEQGNTILHLACLMDNKKAVNVILQKQPHLLKFTNQDLKPLHVVCRQGSVELVKLFLQYSFLRENNYPDNLSSGDNACIYDSVDYHSAIEIAHEKRFTCIVNTLILHKERFQIPSSNSIGESPFHWLCDSNDIGTLEAVLKTDIDPSEQDGSGYTVLHKACERGNKQMVTMLLETGDQSSVFSNAGEAPLHILCRKGFVDLIQMFIDRGADMSVKTKDKNNSVLHVACMYKRAEVCMFLLQRFACLSAEVNDDRYKPLDIAVERRCQKIVKLFVSVHNSKCLWYDYSDRICQKGGVLLLKFMIRCGVNMAERDNMGNTFLHTAVSHGCVDVVLTLQKHCREHFTSMSNMRNEQGELALHFVATKGDTAIVQTLMKYFTDPNVVDSNDSTPLHHASRIGSKDIVLLLLTSGADPFIADAKGNSPLHLAAKGGHEGVCSSLVVNNANCNARNAKGRTSVHEAVGKGYLTITQLLIRSGAHVSVQDGRGDTPLHNACLNEHSDMVQCLLDAGADLSISNLLGNTPLHIASMKGHVGIICQLLRHQELEAVNVLGQTVLHLASKNGHYNVLEIILKYLYRRELLGEHTRQDVSGRDLVNGDTALHLACRTGSVKSVELLKKYGADVNVWNNNGNSPVFVACETGHVDIVKQCLHFAASGINRDGCSLLHIACRTGNEAMVKTLLEYGNVNITDRHGRTPLFDAVDNGHDIISTLLIRMGANVNSTNVYNRTPLHDACWEGRIGCVTLLTASGAQLDARNHYGNTPLHNACIQGHMAIGDLLLERGADSCPVNRVHMTPLHYACLYGYTETAKMLLSKGADPGMENSEGKTPLELCSSQDLKETLTSSCRDTDLTCRKRGSTEVCALPPKKRMRMRIDTEERVDEVGQRSSEDVRRAYISWRMINGTL